MVKFGIVWIVNYQARKRQRVMKRRNKAMMKMRIRPKDWA